jgi:hypothetical protein
VGLGHAKSGQELRHGLGSHGWATVAVDRQLIGVDAFLDERLANLVMEDIENVLPLLADRVGFPVPGDMRV